MYNKEDRDEILRSHVREACEDAASRREAAEILRSEGFEAPPSMILAQWREVKGRRQNEEPGSLFD